MLPGPIIVRAIGHDDRKAVCLMPRPREMVGGGLARAIRGIRRVPAVRGKHPLAGEGAEYFVCRDLDEAKVLTPRAAEGGPVAQRRFQKDESAAHIGRYERLWL